MLQWTSALHAKKQNRASVKFTVRFTNVRGRVQSTLAARPHVELMNYLAASTFEIVKYVEVN